MWSKSTECINRLFPVIFDSEHRLLYENVKKTPKMDSEEQQRRARKNCGKFYRKLLNDDDLMENFLNNALGNRYFFSTDSSAAHPNIQRLNSNQR